MLKTYTVSPRSPEENRYYHSVVVSAIASQCFRGNKAVAHEWVKITFGIASTATLTTLEFETLMQDIRDHAKKYWNRTIPLPNAL